MKKIIFFIVLMLSAFCNYSQDIKTSTITWKSTTLFALNHGEFKQEPHTIKSTGQSTVEWIKADGSSRVFTVSEVVGKWSNVAQEGEIVYEVKDALERGTITFKKNQSGIIIRLLLLAAEGEPSIYELTISDYQVQ